MQPFKIWYRRPESNRHAQRASVFETDVSTNSTTSAKRCALYGLAFVWSRVKRTKTGYAILRNPLIFGGAKWGRIPDPKCTQTLSVNVCYLRRPPPDDGLEAGLERLGICEGRPMLGGLWTGGLTLGGLLPGGLCPGGLGSRSL